MAQPSQRTKDKARKLYLAGEKAIDIAKACKVGDRTVRRWAEEEGWVAEREDIRRKASEKSRAELIDRRAEVNQAYFGIANKALKTVASLLEEINQAEGIRDKAAVAHVLAGALLRLQNVHNGAMGVGLNHQAVALAPEPEPTEDELKREYERLSGKPIDDDHDAGAESRGGEGESLAPPMAQAQSA